VTYNTNVYLGPYSSEAARSELATWLWREPWSFLGAALLLLPALARAIAALGSFRSGGVARAYAASGFESTLAIVTLVLFVTTSAGLRLWPHYFITVIAWFGLIAGTRFEQAVRFASRKRRFLASASAAVLFAAFVVAAVEHRVSRIADEQRHGIWRPGRPDPLCDFIDRHSRPEDVIFI
jgi:hypothetical protein